MARRFSGLIRGSTKFAALLAALALSMLMAVPVLADTLHQTPPIAWNAGVVSTDDPGECEGADLDPGQVLWHFIQNQTAATSGNLTATFTTAGTVTVANGEPFSSNTLHWTIITGEDTLTGASTDVSSDGGQLNLSHICTGGPPPVIPEAPVALLLPAIALLAFGAYLFFNRRRVTDVA